MRRWNTKGRSTTDAVVDATRYFGALEESMLRRARQSRLALVAFCVGFAVSLVFTLVRTTADAAPQYVRGCRDRSCLASRARVFDASTSLAFFEFAPANGSGLTAACACTAVTGAKGETMTFSRASSGTCLKGNTLTGIANGDMVTCSTNQPRVMPGGDGSGGLGLLVEGARTNGALRSQEIENAVWVQNADAVGRNTTVTADQAIAPDATTTAEKVDLIATSGVQYSERAQVIALGGPSTCSLFAKGVSGSGTMDVCANATCASCAFVSTSWSLCSVSIAGALSQFAFGNNTFQNGGTNRPAQSVYVWGVQCEAGTFASSYIATAGATAARVDELPKIAVSGWPAGAAGWSAATTWVAPSAIVGGAWFVLEPSINGDSTNRYSFFIDQLAGGVGPNGRLDQYDIVGGALNQNPSSGFTVAPSTTHRFSESYVTASHTQTVTVNGTATTNTANTYTPFSVSIITIGNHQNGGDADFGVNRLVCMDPDPSRCK
jgi:hypothetical protein